MPDDSTPQQRALDLKTKARTMEAELKRFAPVQLPYWHDEVRAIANELTRCALVSTKTGGAPRRYYHNERLFTLGGDDAAVTMTGEEIRGNDWKTFLTLAHLAREQKAGDLVVRVKSSTICKLNNWATRQTYYTEIYNSMLRLSAVSLMIYSRRLTKMRAYEKARAAVGSVEMLAAMYDEIRAIEEQELAATDVSGMQLRMIDSGVRFTGGKAPIDDVPQGDLAWEIPMDPNMILLFAKEWLTLVDETAQSEMSAGAVILQAYYCGHKIPNNVYVKNLARLLQLTCSPKEQKRIVKQRLQELVDHKVLVKFWFSQGRDGELVHVERAKWDGKGQRDGEETEEKAA
jgi:hypothetical protein